MDISPGQRFSGTLTPSVGTVIELLQFLTRQHPGARPRVAKRRHKAEIAAMIQQLRAEQANLEAEAVVTDARMHLSVAIEERAGAVLH